MKISKEQTKHLERLKKRSDFVSLNRNGKKWTAQSLVLQAKPNGLEGEDKHIRIGFTVTKRTEKSAVKRNRIKRRLRAAANDIIALHGVPAHDYVLIGRPQTATKPYEKLCSDLKWCLKKMGLYVE